MPRRFYLSLDEFDIVRVAELNFVLKPLDSPAVSQSIAGPLKIYPAKPESHCGRTKTSSEDIVESIEISAPSSPRD